MSPTQNRSLREASNIKEGSSVHQVSTAQLLLHCASLRSPNQDSPTAKPTNSHDLNPSGDAPHHTESSKFIHKAIKSLWFSYNSKGKSASKVSTMAHFFWPYPTPTPTTTEEYFPSPTYCPLTSSFTNTIFPSACVPTGIENEYANQNVTKLCCNADAYTPPNFYFVEGATRCAAYCNITVQTDAKEMDLCRWDNLPEREYVYLEHVCLVPGGGEAGGGFTQTAMGTMKPMVATTWLH